MCTSLRCVETQVSAIEAAFDEFTERKDIAILLINQHVRLSLIPPCLVLLWNLTVWNVPVVQIAEKIRPTVDKYQQAFPALLEIPSKDHPYGTPRSFTALRRGLLSKVIDFSHTRTACGAPLSLERFIRSIQRFRAKTCAEIVR